VTYDANANAPEQFEQVRRIMIHDDTRGGYRPAVIGWWDQRGYTHCTECPPEPLEQDERGYPFPIAADNSAVVGLSDESDRCDTCGVSLLAAALERFTYDRSSGSHRYIGDRKAA
jgi:hypothetical protein